MHHDAAVTISADTGFCQTVGTHPNDTSAGQGPSTISRVASSGVVVIAPYRDAVKSVVGIVALPSQPAGDVEMSKAALEFLAFQLFAVLGELLPEVFLFTFEAPLKLE